MGFIKVAYIKKYHFCLVGSLFASFSNHEHTFNFAENYIVDHQKDNVFTFLMTMRLNVITTNLHCRTIRI